MRIRTLAALFIAILASAAGAEQVPPFDINMDRVEIAHKSEFAESKVYFIPTVYLRIAARMTTSVKNENASAKAKIFITGLDKEMLQGVAKKVYDDLVAKIRAAGYTVLTYDDIKGVLTGQARMTPNPKFGFPTKWFTIGSPIDYAIVTPSDEQAIDWGSAWPTSPYQAIAKGRKVVVLVPEIYFNLPEAVTKKESNSMFNSVGLNYVPTMKLYSGMVWGLPPKLGGCSILIHEHGKRLAAEVAGTVKKVGSRNDKYGDWSQSVGDFDFVIDPAAVSTGILRVAYAINDLTVKTIKGAQK